MNAKYSKLYESIILPQGYKMLVHYFNGLYYINPQWDLSCEISNKGFSLSGANSIKGLTNQIDKMIEANVNFDILERFTYDIESLKKHYNELK